MSEQCIGIALAVAGGIFELGGLALVAGGILKDRNKARALFGNVTLRASPARGYSRAMPLELQGGKEPTPEERIDRLEARVRELDDQLFERQRSTDKQVDEAVAHAHKHTDEVDAEMRRHLADVLAGSLTDRAIGAVLFAVGVALSVAANIVLA